MSIEDQMDLIDELVKNKIKEIEILKKLGLPFQDVIELPTHLFFLYTAKRGLRYQAEPSNPKGTFRMNAFMGTIEVITYCSGAQMLKAVNSIKDDVYDIC